MYFFDDYLIVTIYLFEKYTITICTNLKYKKFSMLENGSVLGILIK